MLISKFGNGKKEKVDNLEKKYNIKLEEKYSDFLVKYNGGYTPKTNNKKSNSDIRAFFGINCSKYNIYDEDIQSWLEKGCFPIACDSFGNYYCTDVGKENNGAVYFCNHEKLFAKKKIANSFQEFLKLCESEIVSEESKRSVEERERLMIEEGYGHLITEALRETWKKEIEKYSGIVQEEIIIN